jgi:hypothetical protein
VSRRVASKANAQDVAAEIIRRVRAGTANSDGRGGPPYVVHTSDPPTAEERLQLAACRLLRQPIVIVPGKYLTIEEWVKKYGEQGSAERQ